MGIILFIYFISLTKWSKEITKSVSKTRKTLMLVSMREEQRPRRAKLWQLPTRRKN